MKMECEEKRLEIGKKVAKSQARTRVLDLLDMPPSEAEEDAKRRNTAYNNQMKDENVKLNKQYENWRKFTSGKKYHYSDSLEMETQVMLLLIIVASLEKSQK